MNSKQTKGPDSLGGSLGQKRGSDGLSVPSLCQYNTKTPSCQVDTIPTAAGGPIHWAICDALFTLRDVLEAHNLTCPYEALVEAWQAMGTASYLSRKDRKVWEVTA